MSCHTFLGGILIKFFYIYFISLIFLYLFQYNIFNINSNSILPEHIEYNIQQSSSFNFIWPTPNYHTITSPYGIRSAPANGAATCHRAIDIGAPEKANVLAVANGIITFVGWGGANGYMITLSHPNNYTSKYCHLSPNYIVSNGQYIHQGDVIGTIGPKYVFSLDSRFKDSRGYTNGASTGPHLHFALLHNNQPVNPINYIN